MKDFKNFKSYKKTNKKSSNIKKFFTISILFGILILIVSYSIYKGFYFLKNFEEKKIKYIYVTGNNIINSNYLINSLKIDNNTKLSKQLQIEVYNKLRQNPFIAYANVAIIKPDTLYIDIKEKKPLCIIEFNNRQLLFAENGQYITDSIDPKKIKTNKILHIKMSNLTPQINNKNTVLGLVKLYKKLDKLEKISYISMVGNKFDVFLENGIMVKANMENCDYDKSIERFKIIWPKLLPDIQKIESVSICYPDRIIIKWNTKEINSGR